MSCVRRRLPFPLSQCILRGFNQQRVTTFYFDGLNSTVGRNQHVGPDIALNVHGASQSGILGGYLADNFACALCVLLRSSSRRSQHHK